MGFRFLSEIVCALTDFQLKTPNSSTRISSRKYALKKLGNNLRNQKMIFQVFYFLKISLWVSLRKDVEVCLTGFNCMSQLSVRLKNASDVNHAKLLATIRFRIQRINGERKGLDTVTSSIFRPRIARDVNNYRLRVSVLVF